MKRTCKQCGKEFVITQSEINFYKSKNLSIPKRCKECRQSNKQQRGDAGKPKGDASYQNRMQRSLQENRNQEVIHTSQAKKGTMPKIATAILAVLALVYAVFFGGGDQTQAPVDSIRTYENGLEFRNEQLLNEHYEKHGIEMGFSSAEAYEDAAEAVVQNSSVLHKIEAEDGDDVYYLQESNEFVVVSTDGYIRTYFCPEDGIDYFNRQ